MIGKPDINDGYLAQEVLYIMILHLQQQQEQQHMVILLFIDMMLMIWTSW